MQYRRYLISGKVQGVSYRRFAEREATRLGIIGSARNLIDSRVEILATGSDERLVLFEAQLARGPGHAEVLSVEKENVPAADFRAKIRGEAFMVSADGESPYEFNR